MNHDKNPTIRFNGPLSKRGNQPHMYTNATHKSSVSNFSNALEVGELTGSNKSKMA